MTDRSSERQTSEMLQEMTNLLDLARACSDKIENVKVGKSWEIVTERDRRTGKQRKIINVAPLKDADYDVAKGYLNHELAHDGNDADDGAMQTIVRRYNSKGKSGKLMKTILNSLKDIRDETYHVEQYAGAGDFMAHALNKVAVMAKARAVQAAKAQGMSPEEAEAASPYASAHQWQKDLIYMYAKARGYNELLKTLPACPEMDEITEEVVKAIAEKKSIVGIAEKLYGKFEEENREIEEERKRREKEKEKQESGEGGEGKDGEGKGGKSKAQGESGDKGQKGGKGSSSGGGKKKKSDKAKSECPECGSDMDDETECPDCGTESQRCPSCGDRSTEEEREGGEHCPSCGEAMKDEAEGDGDDKDGEKKEKDGDGDEEGEEKEGEDGDGEKEEKEGEKEEKEGEGEDGDGESDKMEGEGDVDGGEGSMDVPDTKETHERRELEGGGEGELEGSIGEGSGDDLSYSGSCGFKELPEEELLATFERDAKGLDLWEQVAKDMKEKIDESAAMEMIQFDKKLYFIDAPDLNSEYNKISGGRGGERSFDSYYGTFSTASLSSVAQKVYRKIADIFINETRVRKQHGQKRGKLNGKSLYRSKASDYKVFSTKSRPKKSSDFAVAILVDTSGSMSGNGKFQHARNTSFLLGEALDKCGIKFCIYTFSSIDSRETNSDEPMMVSVKDFTHRWHDRKNYISYIQPTRENYDGFCLWETYKRLMRVQATNHVIFVISDGYPSPEPYWVLKKTIGEVRKTVDVIGFGVQHSGISGFYGEKYSVACADPNDLPKVMGDVLSRVLGVDVFRKKK